MDYIHFNFNLTIRRFGEALIFSMELDRLKIVCAMTLNIRNIYRKLGDTKTNRIIFSGAIAIHRLMNSHGRMCVFVRAVENITNTYSDSEKNHYHHHHCRRHRYKFDQSPFLSIFFGAQTD